MCRRAAGLSSPRLALPARTSRTATFLAHARANSFRTICHCSLQPRAAALLTLSTPYDTRSLAADTGMASVYRGPDKDPDLRNLRDSEQVDLLLQSSDL